MIRLCRYVLFLCVIRTVLCAQAQDLRVQIAAPQGTTASIDQSFKIFAVFSEPMTALTTAGEGTGVSGPMSIEPSVRGRYRWLGTTTIAFIPADTLPFATRFSVTVPAGTRSLSGSALRSPFTWGFETPRPSIVRTSPVSGERQIELDHSIMVVFNQPIDVKTIGRWISLEARTPAGVTYPRFTLRAPTDEELTIVRGRGNMRPLERTALSASERRRIDRERACAIVCVPSSHFEKGSTIRLVCHAGLQGKEGPLEMPADYAATFTTIRELKFIGVASDDNFHPASSIRFDFSNPVSYSELVRHLRLTPEAKVRQNLGDDYSTDKQYVSIDLKPEIQYKGTITSGMKDVYGNVLTSDIAFSFRTSSYPPSIRMTTGPGLIEEDQEHRIPVVFRNCDSVALTMGRLESEQVVPLLARVDFWGDDELSDASFRRLSKDTRLKRIWKPAIPRNTSAVMPIALDEILAPSNKGIAYVQLKQFGKDNARVMKTIVQVTGMGLTAKFSPESILIWATRLKDVAPVSGAEIEVRTDSNKIVWRGRTDGQGLARAPGWGALGVELVRNFYGPNEEYETVRPPRLWVFVKKDGDCAFTSSQWNEGIEPYSFGIEADWNPQFEKYEGVIFSDRGLYKASEAVDVKGIVRVRKEGAWHIAPQTRVRVTVTDPRGETMMTQDASLNQFGSLSLRIPLKSSAPTGTYRMAVEVRSFTARPNEKSSPAQSSVKTSKEKWTSIASGEFRVEAFRPAEFDVRSRLASDSYTIGDTAHGFLSAQYLFGAPMKKAPMRWRFSVTSTSFIPKGWETYSFGLIDWLSDYQRTASNRVLASGEGVLDDFGSIGISAPLAKGTIQGTVSLMLEGDATSVSRQTLSGRSTVIVHAGQYDIGVKPSATFLSIDSTLTVNLIAVTKEGTSVEGRDVTVKVFRRSWHSVRKEVTGGRYAWQTDVADSLVDSASVRTTREPAVHRFIPRDAGFYYISAVSTDERGNRLESQATFYASGSGYVAWERGDDDRIELVADRTNYRPGDRAEILVKNPYEHATALVSIEREGILSHYTTQLSGSAPRLIVPIEHAYLPNVFVSVVLLEGRIEKPSGSQASDVGRPSFKVGYVKLSVSPKERQLKVTLIPSKAAYHPGDSASAVITVRDAQGRGVKSEAAVSVADAGVVNLIGYHLPDPFDAFYHERGLGVSTTETRLHLISQRSYGEKGEDAGGGGAMMRSVAELDAEGIRKDFRASAYWNPSLITDDSGRAVIRFKLPDNITSFRIMASAQTLASEFGAGEASFTVSKPVLLQPSMPRLARVGDTFEAGVVVVNYTEKNRSISLTAKAAGIGFRAKDTTVIECAPGQAREVLFHFTAEKIGTAVVTVKAVSNGEQDGLRWTFPVAAPREKETTALFNSTVDANREEAITVPASVVPNEGGVELTAASTAMVGLSGGISYLFTYPYGCLEQRASAVLPIILARELVDAFKFEVFREHDAKEVAQRTIDELTLFQKFNGGFSYWKSDQETSPFVSAYAVYTMIEAKQHGYRVDTRSLDNGLQYLTRVLSGSERDGHYSIQANQCTRALIVYTLARAGRPDFGAVDKLFSERGAMPLFAKAFVMRAAALTDVNSPIVNELARDLMNRAKVDPTGASFEEPSENGLARIFHSNVRTTALIVQAMIEAKKESDIITKTVRRLLNVQRNGRWRTTQENLFVVSALAAYFNAYEHDTPHFRAQIALNGKKLLETMFSGRTLETKKAAEAMSAIPKGTGLRVRITKEGEGRLYYGVRLNYVPKGESMQKDEGLTVLRSIEPAEGAETGQIRTGMLLKVTVNVVAYQDRHYLAVEDPVPAGFEVVSTTFATSASNLEENSGTSSIFNHIERYDDRVALFADEVPAGIHSYTYLVRAIHAGTFVMPSTRAECMYEPEIFGRTQSGTVTIR